MLTSRQNTQIKYLLKLFQSSSFRKEQQVFVIEGLHLLECVPSNQIKMLFIPESQFKQLLIQQLLDKYQQEIIINILSDNLTQKISDLTHSKEIIAVVKMPLQQLTEQTYNEDCLILDTIQDPGNMGTIIRSAIGAGIKHIVLSQNCVDVWMPKVLRASMGAHFLAKIYSHVDLLEFVKHYSYNVYLTLLDSHAKSLYELNLMPTNAWVVGNEGRGISAELLALKQTNICKVRIPMLGNIESLNVATATSLCLFEQARQRLIKVN